MGCSPLLMGSATLETMLSEQKSVPTFWETNFGWRARPTGKEQNRAGQSTAGQTLSRAQFGKMLGGEEELGEGSRKK